MNINKVFLGGTVASSNWRSELIPLLEIEYFNPVVKDWTEEFRLIEEVEKSTKCNVHLYRMDSNMKGLYSLVEIGVSVMTPNVITILQVDPTGFDDDRLDNFEAIINLVNENGGDAFFDNGLEYLADTLNKLNK